MTAREWTLTVRAPAPMRTTNAADEPLWERSELRWSEVTDNEDTTWGLFREVVDPYVVGRITIHGEPVAKGRARFVRSGAKVGAYTPGRTANAQEEIAWSFRRLRPSWRVSSDQAFGVFAVFYMQSNQRRDVDNLLKLVMDALTGIVWEDDTQVAEVAGRAHWGADAPRTEVVIYWTWPNGSRSLQKTCIECGRRFRVYPSGKDQRFCSRSCSDGSPQTRRGKREAKTKPCRQCGVPFAGPRLYCSDQCHRRGQRMDLRCDWCGKTYKQPRSWKPIGAALCSRQCSLAYWRAGGVRRPKGICGECGAPTSRREYKRCRACAISSSRERVRDLRRPTTRDATGDDHA